jgi:hypothetical protein
MSSRRRLRYTGIVPTPAAAGKILDRALGKAPEHVDVAAIKHTEIVYRSAAEIRQELLARGVPAVFLD